MIFKLVVLYISVSTILYLLNFVLCSKRMLQFICITLAKVIVYIVNTVDYAYVQILLDIMVFHYGTHWLTISEMRYRFLCLKLNSSYICIWVLFANLNLILNFYYFTCYLYVVIIWILFLFCNLFLFWMYYH